VPEITADQIKQLREMTSAGVMDCKKALEESNGDLEGAVKKLGEMGIARAAKKAERETAQGLVESYIHAGGRIGVIVEVACETDFVARTPDFQTLARDIAMQIAAMNPATITEDDPVPESAGGRVDEIVLLKQEWIKDSSKDIRTLINETIGKTGENIQVKRFARFEIGE
jgi:elongation factor Ts